MWNKYKKLIIIGAFLLVFSAVAVVAYRKMQKSKKDPVLNNEAKEDGAIISQLDANATRTESDRENVLQAQRMVGG